MKKILLLITLTFSLTTIAQEIKFGKVSKEELHERFNPKDSITNATYLLKKRRTYFEFNANKQFQVVTKYHERIKIYTKEGLNYATKKISYYKPQSGGKEKISSIKAYTFNLVNNTISKQKLSKKDIFDEQLSKYRSQKKITFPNVKKGSIIDIKYTLTSPYWDIETLNFQYNIPIKLLDYKVEIPEYFIFQKSHKGYYNIPLTNSKQSKTITLNSKSKYSKGGSFATRTDFQRSKVNYYSNINNFTKKMFLLLKVMNLILEILITTEVV